MQEKKALQYIPSWWTSQQSGQHVCKADGRKKVNVLTLHNGKCDDKILSSLSYYLNSVIEQISVSWLTFIQQTLNVC